MVAGKAKTLLIAAGDHHGRAALQQSTRKPCANATVSASD
jgi:hypothetical protein